MASDHPDVLNVLMIEDNPVDARILQRCLRDLESWSINYQHAFNKKEGLKMTAKGDYDLILLDYSLTDATGIDVIEAIRSRGDRIPIIVITGNGNQEVASRLFEAGGDGYFEKDQLEPEQLEESIGFVLQFNY